MSGAGAPLVVPAWWVSHLELNWRDQAFRSFWETVGEGHVLVRYDAPGVGMSDREDGQLRERTLETEVALLGAILDELGLERVTLLGGSSGGCAAIALAARFPDRVERLLLYGAYADGRSIAPPEVRDAIITTVHSHWGLGARVLADIFLGDAGAAERERFARLQRAAATPRPPPRCSKRSTASMSGPSSSGCVHRRWWCSSRRPRSVRAGPRAGGGDPGGDADPA